MDHHSLPVFAALALLAIATPGPTVLLALHNGARFAAEISVQPLPFAPLERTLSLSARAGVLHQMPAQVAAQLKTLVHQSVLAPALKAWPWPDGQLRLL